MERLINNARIYARSYRQLPYGREIEGTAELLLQMADKLEEYEVLEEQCIKEHSWGLRMLLQKWKEFIKDIQELYEYRKLEEQGKLLKLPISTKTPIYSIEYCCGKNSNNKAGLCYKGRCEECERKSYHILEATVESSCKIFEIGKSVFLTKEAAEAALKEMSKE